jgi:hypothetical protein
MIRGVKNIIEVTSKGKYSKEPKDFNYLEVCRKDFIGLKEGKYDNFFNYLSVLIAELEKKGKKTDTLIQQKSSLDQIKKLVKQGNERVAFQSFFRTFPSCLPHRAQEQRF